MKLLSALNITFVILSVLAPWEAAMSNEPSKIIKTYMAFSLPVDPANVRTLVDLDLSYALGAPLIDWGPSRELIAGLAESWEPTGEKEFSFKLRKNAKWSDGASVTADQVVRSLERAKKTHGDDLKSLFDLVTSIQTKDAQTIVFKLNIPAEKSGLAKKLTEPMYGVHFIKENGSIDLSKTTGPFSVKSVSESELILKVNNHWYSYKPKMADDVIVRRPPPGEELQESFLKDNWANLVGSSSLIPNALSEKYQQAHYAVWKRSLDKIFFFSPGPRLANEDGRKLFKFLNQKLNRSQLTQGLSGFNLSEQFFPEGYVLHDNDFKSTKNSVELPHQFSKKPLTVLAIDSRISPTLKENIAAQIQKATGVAPKFKIVALNEIEKHRVGNDYDFLAGSLPVGDPNVEGALSFIFGLTPPFIPNAGEGQKNFKARVDGAKHFDDQSKRNLEYRKVFTEATNEGCILPLFHFSSIVIAKEGIDLSQVPTTDETVAFSKVQFR